MTSLVAALDSIQTPLDMSVQMGENNHVEYTWSNDIQEKILQLSFQIVRTTDMSSIEDKLYELLVRLRDDGVVDRLAHLSVLYRMLGQTRDIIQGKGEYALSYMMLWTWYRVFPSLALYALDTFVLSDSGSHPYGSWKDMKCFAHYCRSKGGDMNHPLILRCIDLINVQLCRDLYSTENVSLCAKWVPRESSKYGWLYKSLALDYFKNHNYLLSAKTPIALELAKKKCYMSYRKVLTSLNKELDTVQIKQCGGAWADINHNKTTSITLTKNRKAFLNVDKKGEQRSSLDDRIQCANNFKEYVEERKKSGNEVKGKRVGMEMFTKQALEIASTNISSAMETDVLDSQWRDHGSTTGPLGNMIAMVDTSGSMEGDPMMAAIALGIRVAEKSLIGKRVMTFSSTPTWCKLDDCVDTNDPSKFSFVKAVHRVRLAPWGMNTDFYAAMKMILCALCEKKVPVEEAEGMVLAIFSDMQIDQGITGFNDNFNRRSMYLEMEKMYQERGYKIPHILFWNLRSTDGFPCVSTMANATMLSGFSPVLLNSFCEKGMDLLKDFTPWKMLLETLSHERYQKMDERISLEFPPR